MINTNSQLRNKQHSIRLVSDGSVHHGLTIEGSYPAERDKTRNITHEGGVEFRSPAGKTWFLQFSEFSFVFSRQQSPAPRQALRKAA